MPRIKDQSLTFIYKPPLHVIAKKWRQDHRHTLERGMDRLSERLFDRLKRNTPVRIGALVRSMRLDRGRGLVWKMTENVDPPYGLFQRQGVPAAKINPIVPVRKQALFWPGAAHPVKIVRNHPGIRSNDYAAKTVKDSSGDIKKAADDLGADITTSVIV